MTEGEIDAWFNLVDTDSSADVNAAELDTANRVFDAKCNLPEQVTISPLSWKLTLPPILPLKIAEITAKLWFFCFSTNAEHLGVVWC